MANPFASPATQSLDSPTFRPQTGLETAVEVLLNDPEFRADGYDRRDMIRRANAIGVSTEDLVIDGAAMMPPPPPPPPGSGMVDWASIEAECQVAGLVELLRTIVVDDNIVVEKLKAATAFCSAEGAYSVADVQECGLQDDFIAALEPLRRVPKNKLAKALAGKTDWAESQPEAARDEKVKLRRAQSELKNPGDVIAVRGRKYTLSVLLSQGNAEIWSCSNEEGADRVLKITDTDSALEEVEARKAIGWDQHTRSLL